MDKVIDKKRELLNQNNIYRKVLMKRIDDAFFKSCLEGDIITAKILIYSNCDLRIFFNDCLFNACKNNHYEIVELLIDEGCNIEYQDNRAVNISKKMNNSKIVDLLIKSGAHLEI